MKKEQLVKALKQGKTITVWDPSVTPKSISGAFGMYHFTYYAAMIFCAIPFVGLLVKAVVGGPVPLKKLNEVHVESSFFLSPLFGGICFGLFIFLFTLWYAKNVLTMRALLKVKVIPTKQKCEVYYRDSLSRKEQCLVIPFKDLVYSFKQKQVTLYTIGAGDEYPDWDSLSGQTFMTAKLYIKSKKTKIAIFADHSITKWRVAKLRELDYILKNIPSLTK